MAKKSTAFGATPRGPARSMAEFVGKKELKRLTIDIDPDLHQALKQKCACEGKLMAGVVRDLIQEWMKG